LLLSLVDRISDLRIGFKLSLVGGPSPSDPLLQSPVFVRVFGVGFDVPLSLLVSLLVYVSVSLSLYLSVFLLVSDSIQDALLVKVTGIESLAYF